MSIKVALEHRTVYRFDRPVRIFPHVLRLRPAPHARTAIDGYGLTVRPEGHFLNWQQDPFGNWLARVVFPEPVDHLEVTVGLVADLTSINPFDFFVEEYAEHFPFAYDESLAADLAPYLLPVGETEADTAPGPLVQEFVASLDRPDQTPIVDFLVGLNAAVHARVAYSVRLEAGVQTPDTTLERAIGSCRDSAWLLVSLLRSFGLAARFVSGYLVQVAADQAVREAALDGPSGPTEDFTDLHAWTEVYIPGAGWIGLDPTSALFAGEGHIPLAATPHHASAAPITGATEPAEVGFEFSNTVTRVYEDPRVTHPYRPDAWQRIDDLGRAVDERLAATGVQLTQGGEPTFVSIDDMESAQWTTDADGPHKRERAAVLAAALREQYATGGAVHRGQGKWYPGEPLPRWQIALQWRGDGVPVWSDPARLADPWLDAPDSNAPAAARGLAEAVSAVLGLPADAVLAAHEDRLAAHLAELQRPIGPAGDEEFPAESDDPVGWVLPLTTGESWSSPAWRFRRGRLVLTPGTSAVGLRLPLDSIAWSDPAATGDPSYFSAGPPIEPGVPSVEIVSPEGAATTALAVEARDGFVYVFLPPTERLDDYLDLLHVVEAAAARADQAVVLEGYGPPPDPRLTQLVVTPDPGVIEVNVQPVGSWDELRDLTETLYRTAVSVRLGTETFDLDGRHGGTGGGNHITLGGAEPASSPFIRRPDLLASLLRFWQRHPSLSYLFSGRFIGPTSQAPRFDEGRPEATYEMRIALAELDRLSAAESEPRPWLTDRTLRHLLTDLTGNTHRAEFCIDKLYSPDSSRGRLGLLELRGFEMPPHPHLALVQSLLVRSVVAMVAEEPDHGDLVDWGTALHDEPLSPWGARRDIDAVIDELQAAGFAFERSWIDPFVEFRFPRLGTATVPLAEGRAVQLELRAGIEPWHVLGEEATSGGTARYVDSSLERLQVLVDGLDPERYAVVCCGVAVPLTPTGVPRQYVAGVRYRAWQPWSALHPSIEVHAPVTVELVDLDAGVALGGCTYHVVHPGGRAYETFPVNAVEAESRRSGRFEALGLRAGRLDVDHVRADLSQRSAEYPFTLDLRRHLPTREHQRRRS